MGRTVNGMNGYRGVAVRPKHPTYAAVMMDVAETLARMPGWVNPTVAEFCIQVTEKWIDEIGVSAVWEDAVARSDGRRSNG